MQTTYDASVDAAYVLLADDPRADFATQTTEADSPEGRTVHLDWDADGHLVGIEVLRASRLLLPEVIERAEKIG